MYVYTLYPMLNIDYIIETRIKSYIKIYLLYHPLFIKLCIKFKLYYSYTALIRRVFRYRAIQLLSALLALTAERLNVSVHFTKQGRHIHRCFLHY